MDSVELEQCEELSAETYGDHLISLDSPGTNEFYVEPPVFPRVGEQYQVEIPSLITEWERLQLCPSAINIGDKLDIDYHTGMGSDVPIMWVQHSSDHMKHEQEEFSGTKVGADEAGSLDNTMKEERWINAKCSVVNGCSLEKLNFCAKRPQGMECKAEFLDDISDDGKELAGSARQECINLNDQMNMGLPWMQAGSKDYRPLPGSPTTSWSDDETKSFILSLYIFGKNLVQVRKFIKCKEMGHILSYYYGKFYRSDAHSRWSECRKIRSRRCIHGQRIFTGWRQRELLSRLLPTISKDVQDTLQEATKVFNEGRATLEEYVFTLKAAVGMQVLVESVGIGTGKHDLTEIVLDPVRTNQVSIRAEIPVGKALSSLTSGDIIKFLTGDFRLSKARSNDLFWEAIWPRLLAKGWHSEQPKDLTFSGSKHALVFLVPGVTKFSRKKLVKGDHYFDSVSDVLNKVASDPMLIELEVEGANLSSHIKNEYGWDMDTKSHQNSLSGHQRHCYLRPRLSECNSELMKFTVVDTSLAQEDASFKVRELRSLPVNANSSYGSSTPSEGTGSDSLEELQNSAIIQSDGQQEPGPGTYNDNKSEDSGFISGKGMQFNLTDGMVNVTLERIPINGHVPNDKYLGLVNHKKPVKNIKHQLSRRIKSCQSDHLTPVLKRRRLTSNYGGNCSQTCSFPRHLQLKKEEVYNELDSSKTNDIVTAEVHPSWGRISTNHSAMSSPDQSNPDNNSECVLTGNCYSVNTVSETTFSMEKLPPRAMIDLNLPYPPDFDTGESYCMKAAGSCDLKQVEAACLWETKQQLTDSQAMGASHSVLSYQQPSTTTRRQSTRNRPPTVKALEALASGLLGTKRKGRGTKVYPSSRLTSRPSRRARKIVEASVLVPNTNPAAFSSDNKTSNVENDEWYSSTGNYDSMLNKSYVQSQRKGTHELPGVP